MTSRRSAMGPPTDRDSLMGPPPVPPIQVSKSKDTQEMADKYRKLKRKFFELEEKHKETSSELQRSGQRNVKMREERDALLDRIIELESQPGSQPNGASSASQQQLPVPSSGAFPRSLLSTRARNSFVANLRQAVSEDDDIDVDPLLTSVHVGPLARKRAEQEKKDRMEEEAREARKSARRTRGSHAQSKGKEVSAPAPAPGTGAAQPPFAFAPSAAPVQHMGPGSPGPVSSPAPVLVSSTGTRLRIKPPAPPASSTPDPLQNAAASSSSSRQHSQSSLHAHSQQQHSRSESPLSPMVSAQDEPSPHSTGGVPYSPTSYFRNGNGSGGNGKSSGLPSENSLATIPSSSGSPIMAPSLPPLPLPTNSPSSRPPSDVQRHAKPKRLKAHTVTSKNFSIPMVPRDKKNKPMLPLNVGIMTVINLGEVCMREHFHTERYIFPVGYEVTRRYLSTVDANAEVVYHCTILDGGDGPKFQIVPSDVPDRPVIAGTATGAWSNIVKQANHIRNRQHSNSVSGPDFFGLGQNTIKHLIQELPGADRLRDYVWQKFVEGGPLGGRHAAVIPALPEEYDASVPVGAYYVPDRERDKDRRDVDEKTMSPNLGHVQQQQIALQPGLTQIVLPPPTTSETLNIQEYQPPAPSREREREKEPVEKRVTRMSARAASPSSYRKTSPSPTPHYPPPHVHGHHTRSASQASRMREESSSSSSPPAPAPQPSPYMTSAGGVANTSGGSSSPPPPPPVPATFASIMNAYPAPAATSRPASRTGFDVNGSGGGSGDGGDE